ncbi:MAG: cobalamin-dependent protein [Planctomycetota bacterium]
MSHPPRILLAKIGLDGHDRGVKVLARSFRDAGMEVIYTGLWQTCEATMYAAMQEDVDVVGVSLLSAAHMTIMPELLRLRKELGVEHIPLVLGGIVPEADYPKMLAMGVAAIFNPGSAMDRIVDELRTLSSKHGVFDSQELIAAYERGEDRFLSKLITAICRGQSLNGWLPLKGNAKVIGITGSPGVGKSSFIAKLGKILRNRGKRVAVVAVDPTSPVTGGALLGDRLRMMSGMPDRGLFIRSLSSGQVQGGLGPHVREVVDLLGGYGFDYILVETVGAGQSDVAIREIAQQIILLLMPDSGDAVQFSKAGIMEVATCFVVNKCDLTGADATLAQLRNSVGDSRSIFAVSTVRDEGIDAVADWASRQM